MAVAEHKAEGEKTCKDGFFPVWKWCFKETTLKKLTQPVTDLAKWPEIPWPPTGVSSMCKILYTTFMKAFQKLKEALTLPSKYLDMARQLVNYPFDLASQLVSTALGFLDKLKAIIDDILNGGAGVISDLKKLCNSILSCPYAADTALGALAAKILSALEDGSDLTSYLSEFKNQLAGMADEAINNVREVPLQALNNIEQAYYNLLKQLGIEELIKHANNIAACINSLCSVAELGEKYYALFQSASKDALVEKVKKTLTRAGDNFLQAASGTGSEVLAKLKKAQQDVEDVVGYPNW